MIQEKERLDEIDEKHERDFNDRLSKTKNALFCTGCNIYYYVINLAHFTFSLYLNWISTKSNIEIIYLNW